MSDADIAAGARWQAEIADALDETNFGIVCVTAQNQAEPWLNFEAGALAKAVGNSRVAPLAIDLPLSDVAPPLGQFQAKLMTKAGVSGVLRSINDQCAKPLPAERLTGSIEVWWPKLEEALAAVAHGGEEAGPHRPDRELLEELLGSVRGLVASRYVQPGTREADDIRIKQALDAMVRLLPRPVRDGEVLLKSGTGHGTYFEVTSSDRITPDLAGRLVETAAGFGFGVQLPDDLIPAPTPLS
jgi:hypothetical protein